MGGRVGIIVKALIGASLVVLLTFSGCSDTFLDAIKEKIVQDEAEAGSKDITTFSFLAVDNAALSADVVATITGTNISATVPYGTDVTALVASFSTSGVSVAVGGTTQVSGVTANNFTNPVTYSVTAEDSSDQDYTVTVTIAAPSSDKDITTFSFLAVDNAALSADVTATITGTDISATVPYGTEGTALVASFGTTGVSVAVGGTTQVSGVTANNFTNPVTHRVTAEDSSFQDYTVTVTVAVPTAKELTSFSFLAADNAALSVDVGATITGTAITATVPNGTDVTALVASFDTTGVSVTVVGTTQVSRVTANDFSNPVTYRVTAGDSSFQDYTVTVTIALKKTKDITSFSFLAANNSALSADVTGTITDTDISVTVPYGTDVTALVASFSTTGVSVAVGGTTQVSGVTANNFTNPVIYRVTAEDSNYQDYTVTIGFPPEIVSTSPSDGATSVNVDGSISVTFNKSMNTSSVTTNTSNTIPSGSLQLSSDNFSTCVQMSASPSASNSDKTFTINPSSRLSFYTT